MSRTLGQVAFEAYRAEVKTAFNGDPIPAWDALDNGAPARAGWEAAATAVVEMTALHGVQVGRSRRRPLSEFLPAHHGELSAGRPFEPLSPADEAAVEQARESVPVEADDETDDDAT